MRNAGLIVLLVSVCLASCREQQPDIATTSAMLDSAFIAADRAGDSGDKMRALHIVQDAHNKLTRPTLADEIRYFSYVNIIYNNQKKYGRSIEIADSMLALLEGKGESPDIVSLRTVAYNAKAEALFAQGLYNEAYNYYYLAQKLATEHKDSCSLRTYTYSLAMTLYKQQRFEESAERFKQAYMQASPCPEDFNLFYFKQELLDNIGLCYSALKQYDSAMMYYKKALAYLDSRTGKFDHKQASVYEAPKAVVMGNMAEVYVNMGRYDSAKALYEHSININLQKGYTNSDALTDQLKLAGLYYTTGDLPGMKNVLANVHAELDSLPDRRAEMVWNKLMWQYNERTGDSLGAFRHLRAYLVQNEAYTTSNKALMETDVDMRVRDLEKQYKIDLLTKDRRQSKVYAAVVSVIALMLIAIAALIWRGGRRTRKNNQLLKRLNGTISKQKQQLEVALVELKMKEKDKVRILKSVAHDVMNPIAAIVSLSDILIHDEGEFTAEQLNIINLIKEASTNSLNLSRDIIEASEEIDSINIKKEITDINLLVSKSVELLNFRAQAKKQKIVTRYPGDHIYAHVYKDKMRRVINNILANAIKFSYENSMIEVVLERINDEVHISVKDSGMGIPEKNKPHVFDMFTEAKAHGTSGEIPHGLGLSISLQIARAHNGDIWFESEEGKGSTFHLLFPAVSNDAAA